jgi:predicted nucleic acid-binding protein
VAIFVDSSALVTVYAEEVGRDIRDILASAPLVIAQLTRVELPSAFWRKSRAGELTPEDARLLSSAFEADYRGGAGDAPRLTTVRLTDEVVGLAARLVSRWPLRTGDAVQLASALVSRDADPEIDRFAAFDERLRRAALLEGFAVVPPAAGRSADD